VNKPTKALCPRTLRHVAKWHEEQAEASEATYVDFTANGNYIAASEAEGYAGAHRHSARKLRNDAASITRATKPRKLTHATTLCGPVPRATKRKAER
jgi:hypothetical protein